MEGHTLRRVDGAFVAALITMWSKEGREGATPREDRCSRCNRNDPRAGRFRHRRAREHGAAREHCPKISAMRVDFVRGPCDAVLGAGLTEFAYHQVIATMTIPTHSSALKRLHRNKTTAASPSRLSSHTCCVHRPPSTPIHPSLCVLASSRNHFQQGCSCDRARARRLPVSEVDDSGVDRAVCAE
jgi:hypothetical protein